ncbi:MAG: LuxR C-terminal-related transcriptional regulator [Chloroflexota bacterium]
MILLTTKLHVPNPTGNILPRNHLFERLDRAVDNGHRLTVVTAPAGFGKTTLVTAWLGLHTPSTSHHEVAWVSLNDGDNDAAQFMAYVATALDKAFPNLAQEVLSLLQMPQLPTIETILTTLINYIDDSEHQRSILLVLDDFHLIEDQTIHDGLSFLLDHLPPNLHIIVTSRSEPPLPLSRLRVRNQVTEINSDDLRFNADEIGGFFQVRAGIELAQRDASLLAERTEGWAAALQFAALSLQNGADNRMIQKVIGSLNGRNRQIVDYLLAEVLEQQRPDLQQFLLRTSILERMTAELCTSLTGQSNAQAMLEALDRANLFTIPLDNERLWYRYHHLFAELLRNRLEQQAALEEVETLHLTASHWFEQNGYVDEAIDHALAVQDEVRTAALIEPQLQYLLWGHGVVSRLWRWLDQLSDETLLAHPRLAIAGCYSHVQSINVDEFERYLSILERTPDLPPGVYAQYLTAKALLTEAKGDVDAGKHLARQALDVLPDDDPETKAIVLFESHIVLERYQSWTTIRPWMVDALDAAKTSNNYYVVGYLMRFLGWIAMARGERHHALELAHEALELTKNQGGQMLPAAGFAHLNLGDIYREWDEIEKATEHYMTAIEIGKKAGLADVVIDGSTSYIFHLLRQNKYQDAEQENEAFNQYAHQLRRWGGRIEKEIARWDALVALYRDDLETFGRWAEETGLTIETAAEPIDPMQIAPHLVRYLLALSEQNNDLSLLRGVPELLEDLIKRSLAIDYISAAIWYGVLLIRTYQQQDQIEKAINTLTQTLERAEPGGFIRVFVEASPQMEALLQNVQTQGIHTAYVAQLLQAFESDRTNVATNEGESVRQVSSVTTPYAITVNELIEPLTEREIEVVQLVVDGLKNAEIAEELTISIGTVKRHLSNIYGKLGVEHRTQAIKRIQELGLFNR